MMHSYRDYRAERRSAGYYSIYQRRGRAFVHLGCVAISGRVTLAKIVDVVRYELYED